VSLITTDIAIIGAGPVGLFTVFQAGMLGMQAVVIDALPQIGGQCQALYPEKPIYDIPGYPEISAGKLIEQLALQASPFKPIYMLEQQAESLQKLANGFVITTNAGLKVMAKTVIIAAGCGAFVPNRPPLLNIESYEGKSVHYMVDRMSKFNDQALVIAGGGDSAIDWALNLAPLARKIYLVHRRDKFRAAPDNMAKIYDLVTKKKVELVIPYQLSALHGEGGKLNAVEVKDLDNNKRIIEADHLLAFFGLSMQLGPMKEWGITMEENHFLVRSETMQTNIDGIFAVGDVACYPGKLKLILTGFAEAALACHTCYKIVHPDKALHFQYSTSKGVPSH
jgi:thioredoxin reductase (NADPH)